MEDRFFPVRIPYLSECQLNIICGVQSTGRTLIMIKIFNSILCQGFSCAWISNTECRHQILVKLNVALNSPLDGDSAQKVSGARMIDKRRIGVSIIYDKIYQLSLFQKKVVQVINEGVKAIFIDSLFGFDLSCSNKNLNEELWVLGKWLKELAVKKKIIIFGTTPLSNEIGDREGKHPYITDIPTSPMLAEIADTVMLLHRPELFGITEDQHGSSLEGFVELFIAKSNSCRIGKFAMKIDPEIPTINFTNKPPEYQNFN